MFLGLPCSFLEVSTRLLRMTKRHNVVKGDTVRNFFLNCLLSLNKNHIFKLTFNPSYTKKCNKTCTLTTQISIILRQLIFGYVFSHYGLIPHVMLNFCIHKYFNFGPFLMLFQFISGNLSPYYAYYQPYAYLSG